LVSRKTLSDSSSYWAQGGLAAAVGADDSPALHVEDTMQAGRSACRRSAAELLANDAPEAVAELERRGVAFDRDAEGNLALALEGGHSRRRIVHAGGAGTGRWITERLAELTAAEERIDLLESSSAVALWSDGDRCHGAVLEDGLLKAGSTILSTGGAAALWRRTTNPRGAVGAGHVMAAQAGAELADLEFCQFHPTALTLPGSEYDGMLVTEAVRGEGATLTDSEGERFIDELAPRDEVTVAILERIDQTGSSHVDLDLRGLDRDRFPNIFEGLSRAGIDAETRPVPVLPAAHYAIGGVATDLEGRSTLPGLFAVGECASTGLHGANRLASNSLTECIVLGGRAADAAVDELPDPVAPAPPSEWRFTPPTEGTRDAVWKLAGPLREPADLKELLNDPYPLAVEIARSALSREESRGCHRRSDLTTPDPGLDHSHLIHAADGELRWEEWE
jgi:L-aspartate oxidase